MVLLRPYTMKLRGALLAFKSCKMHCCVLQVNLFNDPIRDIFDVGVNLNCRNDFLSKSQCSVTQTEHLIFKYYRVLYWNIKKSSTLIFHNSCVRLCALCMCRYVHMNEWMNDVKRSTNITKKCSCVIINIPAVCNCWGRGWNAPPRVI